MLLWCGGCDRRGRHVSGRMDGRSDGLIHQSNPQSKAGRRARRRKGVASSSKRLASFKVEARRGEHAHAAQAAVSASTAARAQTMSNPVRASGYVACGVCLGCVLEVWVGVVCCAYGLSVVEFGALWVGLRWDSLRVEAGAARMEGGRGL